MNQTRYVLLSFLLPHSTLIMAFIRLNKILSLFVLFFSFLFSSSVIFEEYLEDKRSAVVLNVDHRLDFGVKHLSSSTSQSSTSIQSDFSSDSDFLSDDHDLSDLCSLFVRLALLTSEQKMTGLIPYSQHWLNRDPAQIYSGLSPPLFL